MIGRKILPLIMILALTTMVASETIKKDRNGRFVGEKMALSADLEPGQLMTINAAGSLAGTITINTGGNKLDCRYLKLLKAETKSEAARFAKVITVTSEKVNKGQLISLRAPATAPWSGTNNSGRLKLEITVPEGCAVKINSAYFDVNATGPFSKFIVTESLSRIEVKNVTELVDVKVSNRPLIVMDVSGQINLINQYGPIKVENVNCAGETGVIKNKNGEVMIESYVGGLEIRSELGRIIGKKLFLTGEHNYVKNKSADIVLSFDSLTTGRLRVNNRFGNIKINVDGRLDGRFVCKTEEDSEVTARNMLIGSPLVDKNRLEFDSGNGSAEIRLTARGSGNIILNGPEGK